MHRFVSGKIWTPVFAIVDLKDATVTISDGAAASVVASVGDGNVQWTEKRNVDYILDKGLIDEVREGDQEPVDVSMQFNFELVTAYSTSHVTVEEAISQTGNASGWTSSDADACRPYAVDIGIVLNPAAAACTGYKSITLADYRWEQLDFDIGGGTVSTTGKCNITTATVDNSE